MAEFPFDDALDYARLLIATANEIDSVYDELAGTQETTLADWHGPHASRMETTRMAEERTDIRDVAVVRMRQEADDWARAWQDQVDEWNHDRWLAARSMPSPNPPPTPRPAPLPEGPDYTVSIPSFVSYRLTTPESQDSLYRIQPVDEYRIQPVPDHLIWPGDRLDVGRDLWPVETAPPMQLWDVDYGYIPTL